MQLDRSLVFALGARVWQAISGPITIVLLIRSLTLPEQGAYYAIIGIVGIQAYFELGLLNVLVGHASHEAALIDQENKSLQDSAATHAAARMRDLIRSSTWWFLVAAVLYCFAAVLFGGFTLQRSDVSWQYPLLATVVLAAISVGLAPSLAVLEGAGFRDLIYRFRFLQMVFGSIGVWLALATGLKLWALVMSSGLQAVLTIYIVFFHAREYFAGFRDRSLPASDFRWAKEVLPLQWRVAIIGAAFHFATQFFAVIVAMFHSDREAGPLGMTLSITMSIQMLAMAWVQTKYPVISRLHGSGDRESAGVMWRRTTVVSTLLLIVACATLVALVALLPLLNPLLGIKQDLSSRFLLPWQVALLSIGCLANHLIAVQGFYVLAQRCKPMLVASLIGATATAIAVWGGGYVASSTGIVIGYAAGMTLVTFPVHTLAYLKLRRRDFDRKGTSDIESSSNAGETIAS